MLKRFLPGCLLLFIYAPLDIQADGRPPTVELEPYYVTGSHFFSDTTCAFLDLTRIQEEEFDLWAESSARTTLLEQPFSYGYANSDTQSNGLTGSAGANLRGLGNLNTLTLINGRRAGGNSAVGFQHGGFADLNLLPVSAISEIQVAADGTSVTYGSDAVAGTVNLILHQDFIGNRVDTSYANTTDGDAAEKTFSFLSGQSLTEDLHLLISGSWYERNAIDARDRKISRNADFSSRGGSDQRSGTFPGRVQIDGSSYALNGTEAPNAGAPFPDNYTTDFEGFNYNAFAPAIPELERRGAMAHLSYDLTSTVEFWAELLYTETNFENGAAPAPWSASGSILTAAQNSPHLPDLGGGTLTGFGYRNLALGNLEGLHTKAASRLLLGLRGTAHAWDWESAILQIKSDLDVEWSGLADSGAVSASILNGSFNPFATAFASGDTGGIAYDNAAALRAAATRAGESFDEHYRSFDFKAGGPVFELPAGEVLLLLGSEYREEEVGVAIDPAIQFSAPTALGRTSGYSPYDAERSVFALFAEGVVPLLGDAASGEANALSLQLASRFENYLDESDGLKNRYSALVHKVGVEYRATRSITLKASYGTAFRAPTLNESFSNGFASLIYEDPTGNTPPSQRIDTLIQANPALEPETSHILNLGLTIEPERLEGLTARASFYRIETKDAITNSGQDLINNEAANPSSVIRTFDASPDIDLILARRFNAAELVTEGIEYELSYSGLHSTGQWEASIGLNQVLRYEFTPGGETDPIDFLGRLVHPLVPSESVQGPGSIPDFKGYARLVWTSGGLTLGGTLHYIHSLEDNAAATGDGQSRTIDSWTSLDLVARYRWGGSGADWLSNTTLNIGIENVTDEPPPFAAGAFADGYDSSLYDLGGRRLSIALTKSF